MDESLQLKPTKKIVDKKRSKKGPWLKNPTPTQSKNQKNTGYREEILCGEILHKCQKRNSTENLRGQKTENNLGRNKPGQDSKNNPAI